MWPFNDYPIRGQFRPVIWKIILEISPSMPPLNKYFEEKRRRQFDDLFIGLKSLSFSNKEIQSILKVETNEKILLLLLLDQGILPVVKNDSKELKLHPIGIGFLLGNA